jgi:hypothetical protein
VHNDEYTDSASKTQQTVSYDQLLRGIDSVYADNPDKIYYQFAVRKLIDTINSHISKPERTSQLMDFITLKDFDEYKLVILDLNDRLEMDYSLKLYILDSSANVITSMILQGCHYNNGEITVGDFDSDSKKEICFQISWPTQSIPVIMTTHAYFKLINNQLKNIVSIVTDERDAFTDKKYGFQVSRDYNFENNQIRITERKYRYVPDSFKFDEEIISKELIKKSTYQLIYNSDSMKFIRN